MAHKHFISGFRVNALALVNAPRDSLESRHNGKVGLVTGAVRDWYVVLDVNGESLRFKPEELICLPGKFGRN